MFIGGYLFSFEFILLVSSIFFIILIKLSILVLILCFNIVFLIFFSYFINVIKNHIYIISLLKLPLVLIFITSHIYIYSFIIFYTVILVLSFLLLLVINFLVIFYSNYDIINPYKILLYIIRDFFILYLLSILLSFVLYYWLFSGSLSFYRVYVIFYFLRYEFIWLVNVFWFRIAIGGMFIAYMIVIVLFLGEVDPYFINFFNQLLFWYYRYGPKDLTYIRFLLLYPFMLIRDCLTVSYHYIFDINIINKYFLLICILFIIMFLFSSLISVWLYEIFWGFYDFCFILSDNMLVNSVLKFSFMYILSLIVVLNLFIGFSSLFILFFLLSFTLEANFIYHYNMPNNIDWSLEIQEEEFVGFRYSLVNLYSPYLVNSPLPTRYHLKMLPQRLCIVRLKK